MRFALFFNSSTGAHTAYASMCLMFMFKTHLPTPINDVLDIRHGRTSLRLQSVVLTGQDFHTFIHEMYNDQANHMQFYSIEPANWFACTSSSLCARTMKFLLLDTFCYKVTIKSNVMAVQFVDHYTLPYDIFQIGSKKYKTKRFLSHSLSRLGRDSSGEKNFSTELQSCKIQAIRLYWTFRACEKEGEENQPKPVNGNIMSSDRIRMNNLEGIYCV